VLVDALEHVGRAIGERTDDERVGTDPDEVEY
jgi:hypothetical protein